MDPVVGELQSFVDAHFRDSPGLRVLEAGCGSSSYLKLRPGTQLIGLDISERQLARNHALSEKILGDIQTYDLPVASFDMIVCWDVLEHLPRPEQAVERLLRAVRNDGVVVLAMPNVLSLKGQITKWTPHWFHVWVYRTVFGRKHAGTDDQGPFMTYLKPSIAPEKLKQFAQERGFSAVFFEIYEASTQQTVRAKFGLVNRRWHILKFLTWMLSFGRIDAGATDYILVLKRTEAETNRRLVAHP